MSDGHDFNWTILCADSVLEDVKFQLQVERVIGQIHYPPFFGLITYHSDNVEVGRTTTVSIYGNNLFLKANDEIKVIGLRLSPGNYTNMIYEANALI